MSGGPTAPAAPAPPLGTHTPKPLPQGGRRATASAASLGELVERLADDLVDRVAARLADDLAAPGAHDEWLGLAGAAEYVGLHRDTVRKRAKAGLIPCEQDGPGCRIYFRRSALDAWRERGG